MPTLKMRLHREQNVSNLLWFGLLGLVVICFMALIFEAIEIETGLYKQVATRVDEAGYRRVEVAARGRDIILEGNVSSRQAVDRIVTLVSSVAGVRAVRPALKITLLRLPHLHMSSTNEGFYEFTGELPDQAQVDLLAALLGPEVFNSIKMNVAIEPETGEPGWLVAAARLFTIGNKVDRMEIEIGAGKISLAGRTDDPVLYQEVMDEIAVITAENGLQVINRLAQLPQSN